MSLLYKRVCEGGPGAAKTREGFSPNFAVRILSPSVSLTAVLCALLLIFAQSSPGPASGGHRRVLRSTSVDSAAICYVPILAILISTSWVACCVQFWVWYNVMLRVSQRVLLQQKLCMHGWSSELAGKLVDQSRTIMLEKKKA